MKLANPPISVRGRRRSKKWTKAGSEVEAGSQEEGQASDLNKQPREAATKHPHEWGCYIPLVALMTAT